MKAFVLLIPVFGFLLVLLSAFKLGRFFNPVSIVVFWWLGWLWISNFGLTGFFIPGAKTQIMVLVMISAVALGSLIASATKKEDEETDRLNERIIQNERYLFWGNLVLAPIIIFFFFRALPVLLSADPIVYRSLVYTGIDRPESAFKSGYQIFLFGVFVSPVVFFSLIVGLALFFWLRKTRLLFVSLALFLIEAVIMLGRFNFYYLLVFVALTAAFTSQMKAPPSAFRGFHRRLPTTVRRKTIKILLTAAAILAVLLTLSLYRGERNVGPLRTLTKIAVDYHTVGLVLFDQELRDPFSRLNTRLSYGRSSLGGIDSLIVIFLRRFNRTIVPMSAESGLYFDEQRVVGEDREGQPIKGNAFFTVLYSLYFDGRYVFVIVFPLFFGYFVSRHYLDWLRHGSLNSLILLLLFLYLGIFSLFQSPLEGSKFWPSLLLAFGMKTFSLGFIKEEAPIR